MALNLTNIFALVNDIKTRIFYGENESLKLMRINEVLLEITDGFYIRPRITSNMATGSEYLEASVADIDDSVDLEKLLSIATEFRLRNNRYKIVGYERPRSETNRWLFRLESIGILNA